MANEIEATFLLDTAQRIAILLSIIGGGLALIWRMSKMTTKFELIGKQQATEIKELKGETRELGKGVERLNDVIVELTRHQGRMDLIDDRMLAQGKRIDEALTRFNDWTDHVYEERHRALTARISKIENHDESPRPRR